MKSQLEKTVKILKSLACETRLKIVIGLLEKKECNVGLMAERLGLAQSNVSQHLTVLKNAGVIEGFRKGTQICYMVTNDTVAQIIKKVRKTL